MDLPVLLLVVGFSGAAMHGLFCCQPWRFLGAMYSIELVKAKGWSNLRLECDSQLVVAAFSSPNIYSSWKHLNRWSNCIYITKSMDFKVSHIYKEGNTCVDSLASYGLIIPDFFFFVGHYSYFHYCCLCESKGRGVNLVGIPSPSLGQLVPAFCNNKKKNPRKIFKLKLNQF